MDWRERIAVDPGVLVGKPVIKGTRIAVELVIDLLARGYTKEQILDQYDHITAEDIQACLAYASETLQPRSARYTGSVQRGLIQSDPSVMMGKPVVAGTRITVESLLERLAAGETMEQILDAHPRLTREALLAAFDFAARALRADVVYPIPDKAA